MASAQDSVPAGAAAGGCQLSVPLHLHSNDILEGTSDWHMFRAASRCDDKNIELIRGIAFSN